MTHYHTPRLEQRCGNCFYYDVCELECRRYAPRAIVGAMGQAKWAGVDERDWCGEWVSVEASK
jgi:hypothetical protein